MFNGKTTDDVTVLGLEHSYLDSGMHSWPTNTTEVYGLGSEYAVYDRASAAVSDITHIVILEELPGDHDDSPLDFMLDLLSAALETLVSCWPLLWRR